MAGNLLSHTQKGKRPYQQKKNKKKGQRCENIKIFIIFAA